MKALKMNKEEVKIAKKTIKALLDDWMLSDENDDYDYFVLVDNNRIINDLKVKRSIIDQMTKEGLIHSEDQFDKREYMVLLGEKHPIPFIYYFNVTEKGHNFL